MHHSVPVDTVHRLPHGLDGLGHSGQRAQYGEDEARPGYVRNQWSPGASLLWAPFFVAAHVVVKVTGRWPADGYSYPYRWACAFGTAVYAAHRDTHFAFLADVRIGDRIDVTRADVLTVTYRVTGMEVVPFDASRIDANAPGRNLVLATCWPLDAMTHGPLRYVVRARMEAEPS